MSFGVRSGVTFISAGDNETSLRSPMVHT